MSTNNSNGSGEDEGTEPLLAFDKTIIDSLPTLPFGGAVPASEKITDASMDTAVLNPAAGGFANTARLKPAAKGDEEGDLHRRIMARMEADDLDEGPDPLLGQEIGGRFTVGSKIGEGGMGAVYRARQKGMDRDVAIKVLLKQMTENTTVKRRFTLEALAVSKLKHPNTIQIFDFGETPAGELYIAMEFLEGEALQDRLRDRGAIPVTSALKIAIQMTKSLREAHGKGIVHRDLKPDNIFLTTVGEETDFVKVLDFGVAKLRETDENQATLTKAGAVFGTPRYMSPEQGASSGTVDQRSDLYAIGVILYEMCTGRAPYEADSALGVLIKHMQEPLPAMVTRRPDLVVPEAVEVFIARLLEKKPEDRPATAEAVIRMMEKLLGGLDDVYRRVVTREYAEAVGIETKRAQPTHADTRLNTGAGQGLLTTHVESSPTMYSDAPTQKSKLPWIMAAALVLVLAGAGGVYAMLEPLPGGYLDGDGHVGLVGGSETGSLPVVSPLPALPLVDIRIDSVPRGAEVIGPTGPVGTTPFVATRLQEDGTSVTYRIKKVGFQTATYKASLAAKVDTVIALKAHELKVIPTPVTTPKKTVVQPAKTVAKKKKVTKPTNGKPKAFVKTVAVPPKVKKKKPFAGFGDKVDDVK